jgi:hypothetical protein
MSTALLQEAIENKLINEQTHMQLLADIEGYTRTAGIPEHFVWTSVSQYCDKDELDYVRTIKDSLVRKDGSVIGMVYVGDKIKGAPVNERMMAIAGVCLRNYINAKVMTVQAVLEAMKTGSMPTNVSVLLIPNFYNKDCKIAKWQISELLGMLYQRQQDGKHTILHISSMKELASEYGSSFKNHLGCGKFHHIK